MFDCLRSGVILGSLYFRVGLGYHSLACEDCAIETYFCLPNRCIFTVEN